MRKKVSSTHSRDEEVKVKRTVGSSRNLEVGEAAEAESEDDGDVGDSITWDEKEGRGKSDPSKEKGKHRRIDSFRSSDSRFRVRKTLGA